MVVGRPLCSPCEWALDHADKSLVEQEWALQPCFLHFRKKRACSHRPQVYFSTVWETSLVCVAGRCGKLSVIEVRIFEISTIVITLVCIFVVSSLMCFWVFFLLFRTSRPTNSWSWSVWDASFSAVHIIPCPQNSLCAHKILSVYPSVSYWDSLKTKEEVVGHGQGRLHAAWTTSTWSCRVGTGSREREKSHSKAAICASRRRHDIKSSQVSQLIETII